MIDSDAAIQFRMKDSVYLKLKMISEKEIRSLNGQILYFALKCGQKR